MRGRKGMGTGALEENVSGKIIDRDTCRESKSGHQPAREARRRGTDGSAFVPRHATWRGAGAGVGRPGRDGMRCTASVPPPQDALRAGGSGIACMLHLWRRAIRTTHLLPHKH